jgi:hypothetical protein
MEIKTKEPNHSMERLEASRFTHSLYGHQWQPASAANAGR